MGAPLCAVPQLVQRTYRVHNSDTVLVIRNGITIDSMTPEEMLANAQAMAQQARRAIEMRPAAAEKLAIDSAILLRSGAPFGLTSNRKILDMAKVEAESNREIRRYMPGGIKGNTQFGRPGVSTTTPRKGDKT